jgi:serine/threonine-protein kinase RsbW
MDSKNYICAQSDYAELARVRDFIEARALVFGFSDKEASQITLAVDEACTNLIRHAYQLDNKREFCVNIDQNINEFIVCISDNGSPFNPLEVDKPVMIDYFKNFQKGGLGIMLMRSVMDEVLYAPADSKNHKNTLVLKKYLHS